MCGRYVLVTPFEELASCFAATPAAGLEDRYRRSYNVAPTSEVLGLSETKDGRRVLDTYRWGLVPSWAKDPAIGSRSFNARAETVATKPSFSAAFKRGRIVVPADGYWEWRKEPAGPRQPYYFRRADGRPLAFAALRESWRDRRAGDGSWLHTCTIITTDASPELAAIHDRMPVVLEQQALDLWLDRDRSDRDELEALMQPAPPGALVYYPVSRRVGDVRNDDPDLLASIARDD